MSRWKNDIGSLKEALLCIAGDPELAFEYLDEDEVHRTFSSYGYDAFLNSVKIFLDKTKFFVERPHIAVTIERRGMAAGNCHNNSILLERRGEGISHTGFALDVDSVWFLHSWIFSNKDMIIETTDKEYDIYVGIPTSLLIASSP